jgi:hypothetical protein
MHHLDDKDVSDREPLVSEFGGHGDVYDTETETDVSIESESEK